MQVRRFEDLLCWKKARDLVKQVFRETRNDRFCRDLKLAGQITFSAKTIMNSISEGFARHSNKEFVGLLLFSRKSITDVQNCLYIAFENKYITASVNEELYYACENLRKLIDDLLRNLRRSH